jgi:NitT/TauT family transport system substrate-binding protein
MLRINVARAASALILVAALTRAACADDTLRIAAGLAGTWENSFSELGQNAGFFKKQGLVLDIFYTQGAGETQQTVISGSADIGTGIGAFNTFGAFAKGAPIRVIGATHTGANDLTWYVRADSPIKQTKDLAGRTVAYSTTGSSTHATVLAFQKVFGVTFTPVSTGSPAATLTQVMSGQIDVGWTSPPFALDLVNEGKIRVIARASDVPEMRNQTVRFMTANATALAARKPVFIRYMQAYRQVIAGCIPMPLHSRPLQIGRTFRKRSPGWLLRSITRRTMLCPTALRASTRRWPTRSRSNISPRRSRRSSWQN